MNIFVPKITSKKLHCKFDLKIDKNITIRIKKVGYFPCLSLSNFLHLPNTSLHSSSPTTNTHLLLHLKHKVKPNVTKFSISRHIYSLSTQSTSNPMGSSSLCPRQLVSLSTHRSSLSKTLAAAGSFLRFPNSDSCLSSPAKSNGSSTLNFGRLRLRVSANSAAQAVEQSPSEMSSGGPTVVEVDLGDRSYPIYIGPGLLDQPDILQRYSISYFVVVRFHLIRKTFFLCVEVEGWDSGKVSFSTK